MTLGQQISQYRKAMGLSQEALGERLGVSRQAVSKWETGAAAPDMENLLALAREFGISVAELTATPEKSTPSNTVFDDNSTGMQSKSNGFHRVFWPMVCAILAVLLAGSLVLTFLLNRPLVNSEEKPVENPPVEITVPPEQPTSITEIPPSLAPETDFALLWYGTDGDEEFLELGIQKDFFPFGTTLELTEPAESRETDFDIMTTHRADCGVIDIGYYHIKEDLELDPESPERENIWYLSTIVSGVRTPRGVHPGSTKAQVLAAYGDDLVYCMKEAGNYTLVKHDYYYAFQTPETFGASLQFFMSDGIVAGIRVEHMAELGNTAFAPDHVFRFPLKDGEPDFSMREEPEQEPLSDTRKVYIAWNQLVTNNNLSAEEQYTYQRDVFSLLPGMDWSEFGQMGEAKHEEDTIFALMNWIANQDSFSSSEILWIQMGCIAKGIDGAYADMYSHILSRALFYEPTLFAKALASEYPEETKSLVLHLTTYDAEWYPAELAEATQILENYLSGYSPNEKEAGWTELLLLHLSTPIENRPDLPQSPEEQQ